MSGIINAKVGDTVVCFDEYSHDYVEHRVLVKSIEKESEAVIESNPEGIILYGKDLDYGEDEEMYIGTVYESNFVKVA